MKWRAAHILLLILAAARLAAGPMDDGERAYIARDYRTALDAYKKALTYDLNEENRARCWYMIGQCNLMLGNMRGAREAFSTIMSRYAKTEWLAHAWLGMGDVLYREKKYKEALAAYKNSLSARFASQYAPSVYYRMALCHRALNNTAEAAKLEQLIRTSYAESLEARLVVNSSKNAPAAASSAPRATVSSPRVLYTVQVSFSPRADFAADLASKLKAKGYAAFVDRTTIKNQTGYRVLVGRYQGREAAQALANKLASAEKLKGFVTTIRSE